MREFKVIEEYIGTFCSECNTEITSEDFICAKCNTDEFIEDRSLKLCEECGEYSDVFYDEKQCPHCSKEYY